MGRAVIGRLWMPQLDVYDAIRRMAGILAIWIDGPAPSAERLYIADFFLANPPLLHKTNMSREMRQRFNELAISRPEKSFLNYPSAQILFQKMDEVQRQALRTLIGKGLVDITSLSQGYVVPSNFGEIVFRSEFLPLLSTDEIKISKFLASSYSHIAEDIHSVRRRTGLRRIGR